jgi:hypothetical protein
MENFETLNQTKVTWEIKNENQNKSEILMFNHTTHSFKRANERNIKSDNISDVIEYGKAFFKQGLIYYVLGEYHFQNSYVKKLCDKSKNMVVVVDGNSNTILTCYRSKNPFKHIKKKQKRLADLYDNAA